MRSYPFDDGLSRGRYVSVIADVAVVQTDGELECNFLLSGTGRGYDTQCGAEHFACLRVSDAQGGGLCLRVMLRVCGGVALCRSDFGRYRMRERQLPWCTFVLRELRQRLAQVLRRRSGSLSNAYTWASSAARHGRDCSACRQSSRNTSLRGQPAASPRLPQANVEAFRRASTLGCLPEKPNAFAKAPRLLGSVFQPLLDARDILGRCHDGHEDTAATPQRSTRPYGRPHIASRSRSCDE